MTPVSEAAMAAWFRHQQPGARRISVTVTEPPAGGYSNELLFATVEVDVDGRVERSDVVVRLAPAGPALFPDYDLAMQVTVQHAVAEAGIPVAGPIVHEPVPTWLGRPFLVMPRVDGRHPGEAPARTEWLVALTPAEQRRLHTAFLDMLADLHAIPVDAASDVALVLRGAGATIADEVAWWERYVDWAFDGVRAGPVRDLFAWCRANLPDREPPPSLLWGDVRLGNTVVSTDLRPAAILDWEMAVIGPAESDLAWFTALSAMTDWFVGRGVPGFGARDEIIAHHERRLGRALCDMAWHEAFALARAAALSVRTGVIAALAAGTDVPDPAAHPVVRYAQRNRS